MSVVDITALAVIAEYQPERIPITQLQKNHLISAIKLVEKMAVKTKLICHSPKICKGQLQMGLDL